MELHSLLSGASRGFGPSLLRGALSLAAPCYGLMMRLRNQAYDAGWFATHRTDVPVVSIGNITTGGTGKTPLVAWTVQMLLEQGLLPGILSRGYRDVDGAGNDEKRLLDAICPEVPHIQQPDRVAGAMAAIAKHHCEVLVLDDGFQHRRLARDLDIVLIDAVRPFGYEAVLPRGLLREPLSALGRADAAIITRVDHCGASRLAEIRQIIRQHTDASIAEVRFVPTGLVNSSGIARPLLELHSARVGACCAIGNPEGFLRTLTAAGLPPPVGCFRTFPDHHHYSTADLDDIARWVEHERIEQLLVTRKDLVKIPHDQLGPAGLWAIDLTTEFVAGEQPLRDQLRATAKGTR
ncbi:MAG: tetraacyldisaccharide 4'-kinase [Planctomycetaceae bacterium]